MADVNATAQSFGVTNVSGLLFEMGENRTPLVNTLKRRNTSSVIYAVSSTYDLNAPSIPAISETASLTAPSATSKTRDQQYNVTQIFMKSFGVGYAKESNMGTLTGINVAGQYSNVQAEWDFQAGVKITELRNDLEYTLLHGQFNQATTDATVNKMRGLYQACPSDNTIAKTGTLSVAFIRDVMLKMYADNCDMGGMIALVAPSDKVALGADIRANGQPLPADRHVAGWDYTDIITEVGVMPVVLHQWATPGTVLFFKPSTMTLIEQPVPGKGNVFIEELGKVGAGTQAQIFGQFGLDYANAKHIYKLVLTAPEN